MSLESKYDQASDMPKDGQVALSKDEKEELDLMLAMGVFSEVEDITWWHNGDFHAHYFFENGEEEFRALQKTRSLPRWIKDCHDVAQFFYIICCIKGQKAKLVKEGRWGLFLDEAKNRLESLSKAS